MRWNVVSLKQKRKGNDVECYIKKNQADFYFKESIEEAYVELEYKLPFLTSGEEYVLFPACCYDGNRFDVMKKMYPPLFEEGEAKIDMPVTITDVPRLRKDGSGRIDVTTGDLSVPCVGCFSKREKKAVLFYTIQEIDGLNLGLSYEKGKITVSYPHMRKKLMYLWPFMRESTDTGCSFDKEKKIEIPYKIVEFECEDIQSFYHEFFKNRKCMGLDSQRPERLDDSVQFEIQKNKMNKYNWKKEGSFYGIEIDSVGCMSWQPGWIGGGMYSYALMRLGGEQEWNRGIKTLEHLFRQQSESGFFYESSDEKGNPVKGIFGYEWTENWHMIRKSADILYYLILHFQLIEERKRTVPENFLVRTRRLADAFVRLWEKYGQYGQFVNLLTGDIIVGGSTSGAIIPGALAKASEYFNVKSYMEVAKESAQYYCEKVSVEGYTTGGPGEILQCPDSESAFALLESVMVIYGITKEEKWLQYGKFIAEFCSSWVVAYNYHFPKETEFEKLGMKTTGCVFANVQNKHAAPGICTLSGFSIYQLYCATGEKKYLELFLDITESVSQFMSTDERPIYSWEVPKDAMLLENGNNTKVEREKQKAGFICERVNMSDWETEKCIGGVFPGSCCWCETSNLMILADRDKYFKGDD